MAQQCPQANIKCFWKYATENIVNVLTEMP